MTLRHARPPEAVLLTDLAHASKSHWGYPAQWIDAWRSDLTVTPEFIERHDVVVCETVEGVQGFFALVRAEEQVELEHFWVRPKAMGRGVGGKMFANAVARATVSGARTLRIVSDPHASGFYLAQGARHDGVERGEVCGTGRDLPVLRYDLR